MLDSLFLLASAVLLSVVIGQQAGIVDGAAEQVIKAYAEIKSADGVTSIGRVEFVQPYGQNEVKIRGSLRNVHPAGSHGFHVHTNGDTSDNCMAAGGHFNPFKKAHGGPNDAERHVGDLGNVEANGEGGEVTVNINDSVVQLNGKASIINRALVIHEGSDDLGQGNSSDSKTTGHAGSRLGCGIIVADGKDSGSLSLHGQNILLRLPLVPLMALFVFFFFE